MHGCYVCGKKECITAWNHRVFLNIISQVHNFSPLWRNGSENIFKKKNKTVVEQDQNYVTRELFSCATIKRGFNNNGYPNYLSSHKTILPWMQPSTDLLCLLSLIVCLVCYNICLPQGPTSSALSSRNDNNYSSFHREYSISVSILCMNVFINLSLAIPLCFVYLLEKLREITGDDVNPVTSGLGGQPQCNKHL